jgi:hypothetical protein
LVPEVAGTVEKLGGGHGSKRVAVLEREQAGSCGSI